jgi:hypothetical protein
MSCASRTVFVWGLARSEQGVDEPCRAAAWSGAKLFRLRGVDANSSLDSRVRAGDKPKSLKTESTIELEVVWPQPPDGRLA